LNLLIAHSTEPALFIDDVNQSPFNVGELIALGDFSVLKVSTLNVLHGSPLANDTEIDRLMKLVGGHPFLIRRALYALRTSPVTIKGLEERALDLGGPFGDHLRRQLWLLRDLPSLRDALHRFLSDGKPPNELEFQRLMAAGILVGKSGQSARFRCELYRGFFAESL
jgi:hypothetical protein